ncbi:MAG: hypothetical protein IH845_02845 [Nanoarchaeota archaeon]|nr:hypothetical protein [Nanoarchaeota archaeon]
MVEVDFVWQLVESMETAVIRLEKAIDGKNMDEANKLKTFIFDLYSQIDKEASRANV